MNDCIGLITSKMDELTSSEKKAADFVIGNLEEAVQLNVHQFSERTGVSEATVLRFCRRLGFEGYRSFCIQMAKSMTYHDDYVMDINKGDGELEQKVARVLMASRQAIEQTLRSIDFTLLRRAASMIIQCRNLLFLGIGTSGIVCRDAALRFLRGGKQAAYYSDYHNTVVALSHYTFQDLVIGISHSGTTSEVCEAMEKARALGVPTIGITTYPCERIGRSSDVILQTITRESPLHKVAITSRTSQLSMIDALFMATLMEDYDDVMNGILRVSDNVTAINRKG